MACCSTTRSRRPSSARTAASSRSGAATAGRRTRWSPPCARPRRPSEARFVLAQEESEDGGAYSRFVLCCRITAPSEAGVRPWFERAFREYGLPRALRTDNGPPFATTGPGRLSHLAVWWLKLGIALDRIDPGASGTERAPRALSFDAAAGHDDAAGAATPRDQQRRFDAHAPASSTTERPHEALGQRAPATRVYGLAPRPIPARLEDPWYDATHQVRRVRASGPDSNGGASCVFVSEAVRGELVGLAETAARRLDACRFMHVELGRIDRRTQRFTPAWHGRRIAPTSSMKVSPMYPD